MTPKTPVTPADNAPVSPPVTAMIFTLNEALHLPMCLKSLDWCDDVVVVDSFSTDDTEAICRAAGVRFFQNAFTGFGDQRNWALDNTAPKHAWLLILDADERVTPALLAEMAAVLPSTPDAVGAFRLKRRFHMWGRWLRYSSLYPSWVVRLVRMGSVRYINRGHAETQEIVGELRDLQHDLIDENIKGIDEWFERQNRYSRKEAEYELRAEIEPSGLRNLLSLDPLVRRKALKRLAAAVPGRTVIYFLYSYIWRRGFLDGRDGLVFCMMRSVYQCMVEAKKHDLRRGVAR